MAKKLRMCFVGFLALDLLILGCLLYRSIRNDIPDQLVSYLGEKENIEMPSIFETENTIAALNVTNHSNGFSFVSEKMGQYQVPVRLFGIVPIKNMDVKVIRKMKVSPIGEPIGIYVETNGLFVLDSVEIKGLDGLMYSPGKHILRSGDYILQWDGQPVPTIRKLNFQIQRTKDRKVSVRIRRNNEELEVAVRPIRATDRSYKIGAWVREDTQGIGTLTYITEQGKFGTLGHGISDVDTGTLLNLHGGEMYSTKIVDVIKGNKGEPGELQGYIDMVADNEIGKIKNNTDVGVFGTMNNSGKTLRSHDQMPVGMKQELKQGEAFIYLNLEGTPQKYKIEIEEININSHDNKSFVIHVVDDRLLKLTGGIVQGMSGSPILQKGKIVGAVTHVFVDDPTRGYGVFIEEMLEKN